MDESDFHCIICLELPPNQVHQCSNGHIYCIDCWRKMHEAVPSARVCGECRSAILDNMDGLTLLGTFFLTFFVVVLIASLVYFCIFYVFGLPEDDRPTFECFGKSEPLAPPTRTSPRRQEFKPNNY